MYQCLFYLFILIDIYYYYYYVVILNGFYKPPPRVNVAWDNWTDKNECKLQWWPKL